MKMTGNGLTLQMEDMSMSYLMALLAKNGYSLLNWNHDTDGVDATVSCKGLPAEGCLLVSPKLDIQLKSSYSKVKVKQNGDLTYELEAKNYKKLTQKNVCTPTILVLLHMFEDQSLWLEHTADYLKITKCAYWVSLKNADETNNSSSVTVTIPKDNVFSHEVLKTIMIKVANNEEL